MLWQHVREIRVTECRESRLFLPSKTRFMHRSQLKSSDAHFTPAVEEAIRLDHAQLHIHVYRPSQQYIVDSFSAGEPGEDDAEDGNDGAGEDADIMAATVAQLPSVALEGVWDTLIYEDAVKLRLLNYINSTQIFGDRMVDFNVITWNRWACFATMLVAVEAVFADLGLKGLSCYMVHLVQVKLHYVEL